TDASIRAWSQLAATVPVQNARPHSGSYSLSRCGTPSAARPATIAAIPGGTSRGAAAIMPSQSPIDHWSPRYLLHRPNIGPMVWRIECPHDGLTSELNTG